jgi:hypothetical protein
MAAFIATEWQCQLCFFNPMSVKGIICGFGQVDKGANIDEDTVEGASLLTNI